MARPPRCRTPSHVRRGAAYRADRRGTPRGRKGCRMTVQVRGAGIAAACAAHILKVHRVGEALSPARQSPPFIALNQPTCDLLNSLGCWAPLREAHMLRKKLVRWSIDRDPILLEQPAAVVPENAILNALTTNAPQNERACFTIDAESGHAVRIGNRKAWISRA